MKYTTAFQTFTSTSMAYCISKSEEDVWFKEATKHITDMDVIEPGCWYENNDLGIYV
jgi:hypothetical protein